jgi:hypothetical protein
MAWKRHSAIAGAALGLAAGFAAPAAAPRHEMRFWYDDEAAARRAGARAFEAHPCGSVAVAAVERMPPHGGGGALEGDLVVEYGADGREARRWSAPVDGAVWAVRGEELLIRLGDLYYWIGTDGRIAATRYAGPPPMTTEGRCGTPAGTAPSAYNACHAFRDEADGRIRNIWFQNACT